MKYSIKAWGKGLNLDLLPSELDIGFCSGASTNVRFPNGFAERVGGIGDQELAATTPYWIQLFPNATPVFKSYLTYASETKAYAWDHSATHSEITRYTEGVTISSITRSGTTATVTTATAHGRTTGNTVSVWGALPSQYNGTYVITVLTANTFTYTMASDPGASATTVGLYSYNGATQNFTNSMATFSGPQQYSGGVFNGVLLVNSPADGLYYWNGDTATRLRKIPDSYKARVSRAFGNYIFQLAPMVSGIEFPRLVAWSSAAEAGSIPTSFTALETNDAGDQELAAGGELVDCLPLGDANIIYTQDGRYSARYIGGQSVFSFDRLPGTDGLLYRGCVVDTPAGHVFLSRSLQVMLHNGGECKDLSTGRVSSLLKTILPGAYGVPFLARNPSKTEVWVCFPTSTTNYPDTILMWNWTNDTWGRKDLSGVRISSGTTGVPGIHPFPESLYLTLPSVGGSLGRAEGDDGDVSGVGTITATLERTGLDCGDADVVKNLQRSRWNFDAPAGSVHTIYHGSSMTADATPTYASSASYTVGTTDYVNARATGGRFLAVKVTWNYAASVIALDTTLGKVRSCDLDFTPGGTR